MVLGKLDRHMQNNELDLRLTTYPKIISKWVKNLDMRPEIVEENTQGKLLDSGLSNDFFGFDTKNKGSKSKNE